MALRAAGHDAEASRLEDRAAGVGFGTDLRRMHRDYVLQLHIWPTTGRPGGPMEL